MAQRCPRCAGAEAGHAHSRRKGRIHRCFAGNKHSDVSTAVDEVLAPENSEPIHCCFEPEYTCQGFPPEARDPFWPTFAHPRWLCCRKLYRCCRS